MLFSVLITIIHGNLRADTAYTLFDPPYYFPLLSPSLLLRKTIFCVKDKLIYFPNIYRSLENGYFTIITSSIKRRKYFTFRLDFTSWCWFCLNEKNESWDIYQSTNDKWTGRYPIDFPTQCIALLCTGNILTQ